MPRAEASDLYFPGSGHFEIQRRNAEQAVVVPIFMYVRSLMQFSSFRF